jgi:hypothetical protein
MKSIFPQSALRFGRFALLLLAFASAIALTLWEFWENQMAKPVEEHSIAVTYFVAGSKRDDIQLLLARQLGLTNAAPLALEDARREFALARHQLQVSWKQESRHSMSLGEYILGTKYKLKLALAYIVAMAVLLETYLKMKAAWHEFRDR